MATRRSSRAALAAATLLVGFGLSSCGSDEATASELLDQAASALEKADVVTVDGSSDDGDSSLDLDITFVGDDASGAVGIDELAFDVLGVDDQTYFRADATFWKEVVGYPDEYLPKVVDHWVETDTDNPSTADYAQFADRATLLDALLDSDGKVSRGDAETVDGRDYDVLVSVAGGAESRLFLDAGSHRPWKIESPQGTLEFSYEDAAAPKAPAPSDIVDLTTLTH